MKDFCQTCDIHDHLEPMKLEIKYLHRDGYSGAVYGRNMCGWCMVEIETFFNEHAISECDEDFNLVSFRSSGFNAEVFMTEKDTKRLIYFMTLHRLPNTLNDSTAFLTRPHMFRDEIEISSHEKLKIINELCEDGDTVESAILQKIINA